MKKGEKYVCMYAYIYLSIYQQQNPTKDRKKITN